MPHLSRLRERSPREARRVRARRIRLSLGPALAALVPLWPATAPGQGAPIPLLPPGITRPTAPAPPLPYQPSPPSPYPAASPGAYQQPPTQPPAGPPAPIVATPLPPPSMPSSAAAGASTSTEPAPAASAPSAQSSTQAAQQPAPSAPEPPPSGLPPAPPQYPNAWVPQTTARLLVLNKVDARRQDLTVKVGQSGSYGALSITVKSCLIRPPDQPADATAFLVITDSHKDGPGFSGWTLANEPWLSMLQNPLYDVWVVGCQP